MMNSSTDTPASDAGHDRIAKAIFPNWQEFPGLAELESRFPARELPAGALVTRVCPSPTGMMHIGGLYTALINHTLALQTNGVFYLRVEDTDQKRTVEGAIDTIVDSLADYELLPSEGFYRDADGQIADRGAYGPYLQTRRSPIYDPVAFELTRQGKIYPCFMKPEELEEIREKQRVRGLKRFGIFGEWARGRKLTEDQIMEKLAAGDRPVLRLRAPATSLETVSWNDVIRGRLDAPRHDMDTVLLKADGIPTYHFAHLIDDHFMRTTHVIRAEEWISSVALHLQLFKLLDWTPPAYGHIGAIQKLEGGSKRKLSKRKDPEADVRFYWQQGFPKEAVVDYLMNLANSNYEDWRRANPLADYRTFPVSFDKMSVMGPLADFVKLESISKVVLGQMPIAELGARSLKWAEQNDPDLGRLMAQDLDYAMAGLDIERSEEKVSKRLITLRDLRAQIGPFYDELLPEPAALPFPANVSAEDRRAILARVAERFDGSVPAAAVFDLIKEIAADLGYAAATKAYKAEPDKYKGHVGDVAMVVRVAMFGSTRSPDLGQVMTVLTPARVRARCERSSGV